MYQQPGVLASARQNSLDRESRYWYRRFGNALTRRVFGTCHLQYTALDFERFQSVL